MVVVVRAAADRHRQSIGSVVCHDKQIRRCLGGTVRAGGMDRGILMEEQIRAIQWQITVHLIRGHLMITPNAILSACIHQHRCTDDIGLQKTSGFSMERCTWDSAAKLTITSGFSSSKKGIYSRTVADIEFYETKIRLIHHRCERGQIARIGQGIQTYDAILWMFFLTYRR